MVQLNRSMMERYEIPDARPHTLRALLLGADRLLLGAVARLLDEINRAGGDLGAACVTRAAGALQAQDCMFTLLVRGDNEAGGHTRREQVVQSILRALNPETEFDALLETAALPKVEFIFLPLNCDAVDLALCARCLHARMQAGMPAPRVILPAEHPLPGAREDVCRALAAIASGWTDGPAFAAYLEKAQPSVLLCESLNGPLNESEAAKARHDMNYRDDFIAWAEPMLRCTLQGDAPEALAVCAGDFDAACLKKQRVFDALVFLCATVGYLSGKDTFAQVLRDEKLRAFIGGAFFEELMPGLPWARDEIAPEVISAFSRLENSMNDMPLLELGRGLLGGFARSLLPAIRAWADREFEAPRRLSLAFAAAVMIYAGAREAEPGRYEVLRGDARHTLHDDPALLAAFSCLAHDMPAESLAYAVLADRDLWGMDLREIDGLELRLAFDLSAIQRTGGLGPLPDTFGA